MTDLSEAMGRLIDPWTMTVPVDGGTRTQHFPPLVDMLKGMVAPSSGRTVGGVNDPSARSVINIQALDLLEHIQDVTGAWLQEWRVQRAGDLKLDLRGFWDRLHTLHRVGDLDDDLFERLTVVPDQWATKIWDQVDPPLRLPLRGLPCPRCGRGKWASEHGDQVDNVMVEWRAGLEPTASCQWGDCAAIWVGDQGLEDLGAEAGMDVDVVALREARLARHAE